MLRLYTDGMSTYAPETIDAAKFMFLRRCSVAHIKEKLKLKSTRVVYYWAKRYEWEAMLKHETVEESIDRKLIALIEQGEHSDRDLKVMAQLGNLRDKMASVEIKKARAQRERSRAGQHSDGDGKKRKTHKNDISSITQKDLDAVREKLFYNYQHRWYKNRKQRRRFILKSRQIGATFYFAWEAFENAVIDGENNLFLSASKAQAEQFKTYIFFFAQEYFGIELSGGDTVKLSRDGKAHGGFKFVGTNASTAQSYHGNLYVDEVFWIPKFQKINEVATGMAAHDHYRITYMSTPSIKSHGAYPLWSGDKYNEQLKQSVDFDLSHAAVNGGVVGVDGIWRDMVNVEDAVNDGFDKFNIENLKNENSPAEFNCKFMCAFMEAGASVFTLGDLMACAVDSNVVWVDFKKREVKPFGDQPVWVGYDPARTGDRSTVVVLAPPLHERDKFRVLEVINLRGAYTHQARAIKKLTERYNVTYIGIDCTGPGVGVFDMVRKFNRKAVGINYSLENKTRLVLKAQDVISDKRLAWDENHKDIAPAFLQVHQTTTGGDKITYSANRTATTGHADVAFAIMHALFNEPLTGKKRKTVVG